MGSAIIERRNWLVGLALAACLAAASLLPPGAARAANDPVEDLRQALPQDDVGNPSDAILQFRRANLQKKIDALKSVGELRRALALDEWRDHPTRRPDPRILRIDTDMRTEVSNRLTKPLGEQSKSAAEVSRLAVANLIAEMGPSIRALNPKDRGGFGRSLLPIVKSLATDPELAVRQEALRALGNINAKAEDAAPILANALKKDTAPGARRVAADSLAQMVRVVTALNRFSVDSPVFADQAEVLKTIQQVLQSGPAGFEDADPQVRMLAAEAVHLAIQGVADMKLSTVNIQSADLKLTTEAYSRKFPPAGRPRTPAEENDYKQAKADLQREIDELRPVLVVIREQALKLAPLLADSEASVRLTAVQALMNAAIVRQQLRQRVMNLTGHDNPMPENLALLAGADPLEQFLPKHLGALAPLMKDSDTRIRRAAVTFLLVIEDQAAPLAANLNTSLADPDRTIRWIAVRSLGNLAPESVAAAVPNLALLLRDPDLMIRIEAARTLEILGPPARAAREALARAILIGDAEPRIAALHALSALAPEDTQVAIPQMIEVLGQRDAEPKVLVETASALAKMGQAAESAIPTLRRLIGHDNSDVRTAASEAILTITSKRE